MRAKSGPDERRGVARDLSRGDVGRHRARKPLRIAYLGPEATNTHQAAIKKFGASVEYHGMATIADIFTAVEKGEADYGVIPIENSTEGSVRDALDQFVDSDLKVVAQIYLEITHALISRSPLEKIEKVYSKDQALAQCRMWLQRYLPHAQIIDSASTSSAVQIAKKTPGVAAVASPIAAEYYGVPVVATNIQDKPDNTTRFFVVGKQASGSAGGGRDMTSFLISLGDNAAAHPGALLKMLLPLAKRGINLSKIESRPSKKRPWDYFFFIDVTGHYDDPGNARGGQTAEPVLSHGEMAGKLSGRKVRSVADAVRSAFLCRTASFIPVGPSGLTPNGASHLLGNVEGKARQVPARR